MNEISCVIYVEPCAKGRPRSTIIAGHVSTYTPKKTRTAEADIKAAIRREVMKAAGAANNQMVFAAGTLLHLVVTFYRRRPDSSPKRVLYPVTKPDGNNYEALLFDALQNYIYPNDSQIVTCVWCKRYCLPGQVPRIDLKIREEET